MDHTNNPTVYTSDRNLYMTNKIFERHFRIPGNLFSHVEKALTDRSILFLRKDVIITSIIGIVPSFLMMACEMSFDHVVELCKLAKSPTMQRSLAFRREIRALLV